jgi:hypothetical protein
MDNSTQTQNQSITGKFYSFIKFLIDFRVRYCIRKFFILKNKHESIKKYDGKLYSIIIISHYFPVKFQFVSVSMQNNI